MPGGGPGEGGRFCLGPVGIHGWVGGADSLIGADWNPRTGIVREVCSAGRLDVWGRYFVVRTAVRSGGGVFHRELSTGVVGRLRHWHSGGHAGVVAGPDRSGAAGRVRRLREASHGALSAVPCSPGRGRAQPGAAGAGAVRTAVGARGGSVCGLGTGGIAGPQGEGGAGPRGAARNGSGGGCGGGRAGGGCGGGRGRCPGWCGPGRGRSPAAGDGRRWRVGGARDRRACIARSRAVRAAGGSGSGA